PTPHPTGGRHRGRSHLYQSVPSRARRAAPILGRARPLRKGTSVARIRCQGANSSASATADERSDQWVEAGDSTKHGTTTGTDGAAAKRTLLLIRHVRACRCRGKHRHKETNRCV